MNNKPKTRIEELRSKFESGFLGFWIRQYRISYLIVLGLIVLGFLALSAIPKESSPSIKFGIISVVTVYPGTNPNDIDTLITDKIYKEVKDIKGIDKIDSNSSLGVSSITLTLKTDANTKDVINEVRNNVNRVILPADAKAPVITEVNTDTKQAFSIYVYAKNSTISQSLLMARAQELQDAIEGVSGVEGVKFAQGFDYDIELVIDAEKLKATGLTIDTIANTIRAWNRDVPVGNFGVGEKNYDFRIEGKYGQGLDFLSIPLGLSDGSTITLGDIASMERVYKDKSISTIGLGKSPFAHFVALTVNKTDGSSIFTVSNDAKKVVEDTFKKGTYKDFGFEYGLDLADNIRDDYKELAREALTTLVLVFIAMYLFVGFRDSLFASLTLPLAFLCTFLLLYYGGFTLNFLTNFSLILSFGIAVDTIIVIVQAASAKIRVGYDPRSAIMLALHEYAVPIISGVMTTIVVFIPMMALPGILGKFLAYIPITIFGVLASGLVLALTVNSALYLLFVKKSNTYVADENAIEYAEEEERELLALEREGKQEIQRAIPLRIRVIHACTSWYKKTLRSFLENTFIRRLSIAVPFVLLILSFLFLAPAVGFDLFPSDDNSLLTFTIEGPNGQRPEEMYKKVESMSSLFTKYPEIRYTTLVTKNNESTLTVQLYKKDERKAKGERSVFDVEKLLVNDFAPFQAQGLKITSQVAKNGPPGSKAVGLKLIANKAEELPTLIKVAHDFEGELKTIKGTKNVGLSSKDTPGQFVFTIKKEALALYGISPAIIYSQLTQMMNGVTVGSIEDNGTDMNIVLKMSNFREKINIEDIFTTTFTVGPNTYQLGNFIDYNTKNSIASVEREAGKVQITVDADLETGIDSVSTQSKFTSFADKYNFPPGISYKAGGENEANKELITAVLSAFFIAILIIFAILTLQFNSFSQPAVILYSVIMSLPMVMLGLLLTGNKFSLPFGIGFIAFTGIAVNHGIILIDAINQNLKKGMEGFTALVEAGSSRLEPMTLTTVTTVLGILPIALRDKFWSGMGFTIIFGIISASTLTLFVVKGIYYEIYIAPKLRKGKGGFFKRLFKRSEKSVNG